MTATDQTKQDLMLAYQVGDYAKAAKLLAGLATGFEAVQNDLPIIVVTAFAAGELEIGERALRNYLDLAAPERRSELCRQLADSLADKREYLAACCLLETWLAICNTDADGWNQLGNYSFRILRSKRALEAFDEALRQDPDFHEARYNRATLLVGMGDLERAETEFGQAFAADPECPAVINFANNTKFKDHADNIPRLLDALAGTRDTTSRIALHFSLGKAFDDIGDYPEAFEHYREGNSLKRASLDHDRAEVLSTAQRVMENFDASWIDTFQTTSKPAPIFLVGLPRSGSTLVERIIASTGEVKACGETFQFQSGLAEMAFGIPGDEPADYARLLGEKLEDLADRYAQRMQQYGSPGKFSDKTLHNFWHVGIIAAALPEARFIFCRREPISVCFACYRQLLGAGEHWAYSFKDISHYHDIHLQLMQHWLRLLPDRIHVIEHEKLVTDSLGETSRLQEFCGLEKNAGTTAAREDDGIVQTLSARQVREPITSRGIYHWRNYSQFLGPLLDQLDAGT